MEKFSKICNYEDFETISVVKKGEYTTSLVQDPFSGERYVKKELSKEKLPIYQKLQELKHQGLAEIIEVFEKDDKIIVIIEYAVGETLKSILDRKVKLEEKVATSYIQQLTSILNVVHQNGIIHRDINPSNIIIATNGQVKLIDFDIARFYKYNQTEDTQLLGTPGYAAPEQFGFNQTTASSDIYALGVLLNVMLTGMKPNEMQINNEGLAFIVKNCTSMEQSLRYQDVMQLNYDLRRLRHSINNDLKKPEKPLKKSRFRPVMVILAFLLFIGVGYFSRDLIYHFQSNNDPEYNAIDSVDDGDSLTGIWVNETTESINEAATTYTHEAEDESLPTEDLIANENVGEPEIPIVLESGYGLSIGGINNSIFLHYGLILENPNENFAFDFLRVRITARCANNTVLGSRDFLYTGILYPNQTLVAGGQAFSLDEEPAAVDFEVLTPEERHWISAVSLEPHIPLIIENSSLSESGVLPRVTGEVINENDYAIDDIKIAVIFRDENDQIVGGSSTFTRHLSANSTLPFDFTVNNRDIITDTYEVHAHAR